MGAKRCYLKNSSVLHSMPLHKLIFTKMAGLRAFGGWNSLEGAATGVRAEIFDAI